MISLEFAALNLSLGNENNFRKLQSVFFSNQITKSLYDLIRKNYIKTNHVVNLEGLKALSLDLVSEFKKEEIESIIEGISSVKTSQDEFELIISKLKEISELRIIIPSINEINQCIKENNISKTKKYLFDIVNNLSNSIDGTVVIGSQNLTPFEDPKFGNFIPTGYEHLDYLINGFFEEELIVISAKRGTGKSALALNLGRNMFLLGHNPVYLNLEMSKKEWLARYLSLISGIPYEKIRSGNLSIRDRFLIQRRYIQEVCVDGTSALLWHEENKNELCLLGLEHFIQKVKNNFRNDLKKSSYSCCSLDYKPTTADISLKIKELVSKKMCDILFIDYINFIKYGDNGTPMWQNLMNVALDLKYIAKTYKMPIVVLAQYETKEKDVKYSRAISETADTVFTWEPSENSTKRVEVVNYSDTTSKKNKDELKFKYEDIEKNKRIEEEICNVYDFYTIKARNIRDIKKGNLQLINILKFMKCDIVNPILVSEEKVETKKEIKKIDEDEYISNTKSLLD